MSGLFAAYWDANGGLAQQGFPITDAVREVSPTDGRTYLVQYFERARFEHHPEFAGTSHEVLLGLLGREQFTAKYPAGRPAGGAGDACFAETGRCVRGPFFSYWEQQGGLAQQGFPISDEFDEVSPTDGRTYRVQYFERARFEYHPGGAGVLLGLLGREQLQARSPQAPAPSAVALDAEERAMLDTINRYRAEHGLVALAPSPTLTAAAEWLSADMIANRSFSHTDSQGRDPFQRMCAFGYCYNTAKGENIAAGHAGAAATFAQWRESADHNAIMLGKDYTAIGIARVQGGQYGWYWTATFGGRRD
jgi:uncharacterized protein YkwD